MDFHQTPCIIMYRYNVYIAKHLTATVALVTVSLTSIIWLTQALRFIDFIVRRGISFTHFLELTLLLIPSLMLFILPFALLCSILIVYYRLMMDSELLVLSGAGLSRFQIATPAIAVATGVTALSYAISLYLLPVSYHEFKNLQTFMRDNYATLLLQEDVFNSPVDGLTVYIHDRDKDGTMRGIIVHDSREENKPPVTMMAEEGRLEETPQGPRFLLRNGNRQEVEKNKLSFLDFEQYTLDLSFYTPGGVNRARQPEEMFVSELLSPGKDSQDPERLIAEGHNRITWPLFPLAIALFSVSVLLTGELNRRGQWQRITSIIIICSLTLSASIGLLNFSAKHAWMISLMYLNVAALACVGLWLLSERSPYRKVHA
jgi:lipopolysaccharide export system permease protein